MSTISKPKIILTGTYSSFNKGDCAMQTATARQIRLMWPDAEITISSPFPHIDKNAYKDYSLIKSTRRNILFSTLQVLRAKFYSFFKKLGLNFKFLVNNEELRHFREADLIVDLSGDTLTEDYGPHVTYSHFLPIWLGLSFKKPVFICAQSIGPFKLTKGFSRYLLNKTSRITAREDITYKYLSGIGVDKKILQTTSDMAFLLEPAEKNRIDEILKNEKIKISNKPLLGVTVSNLVAKRFDTANPDEDFISVIARVLDEFITKHKASVLLLGHVTGPSKEKDDRLVIKRIKQKIKQKNSAFLVSGDYTPGELKGIISRCDIFMGSRMHSNIAALSSCVPTLAIGYSHKTRGIMSLFKMDKFTVDIDRTSGKALFEKLGELFSKQTSVSKELKRNLKLVKSDSKKNLEIINNIVGK